MKAKTKKLMYDEMKNNLIAGCRVHADSAGRFSIATKHGIKTIPACLQSFVSDEQAKQALSQDRISFSSPNDFDDFIR